MILVTEFYGGEMIWATAFQHSLVSISRFSFHAQCTKPTGAKAKKVKGEEREIGTEFHVLPNVNVNTANFVCKLE